MNKKGFTGVELAVVLAVIAVIGYFSLPPTIKSVGTLMNGGDKNQTRQIHKVEEQYSMFYKDEKGNFKPAPTPYKRKEEYTNLSAQQPPETLWSKFKAWILLAIVLAIAFPSFALKVYLKAKANVSQLVNGIEQAKKTLPKESVTILENSLSKKMDTSAKKVVKKAKIGLAKKGELEVGTTPTV